MTNEELFDLAREELARNRMGHGPVRRFALGTHQKKAQLHAASLEKGGLEPGAFEGWLPI